jgi:hypothetical protein
MVPTQKGLNDLQMARLSHGLMIRLHAPYYNCFLPYVFIPTLAETKGLFHKFPFFRTLCGPPLSPHPVGKLPLSLSSNVSPVGYWQGGGGGRGAEKITPKKPGLKKNLQKKK